MHMKQSPYQLHPQQFLSSSSNFYIMLHMCILWCVSSFEKKTYSDKYEWESLLLLSELSISALPSHSCLRVQELHTTQTHTHTHTHTHTYTHTHTHTHTDTHTQRDRQTDTHTHTHTDRQTDRQTDTHTHTICILLQECFNHSNIHI